MGETAVMHQLCRRKTFPRSDVAGNALRELKDAGYIRLSEADRNGSGDRLGCMLTLHPGQLCRK